MKRPGVVGITATVTVLLLGCPEGALAGAESPTVELRLGARGGLDDANLRLAEQTVGALLSSAGIKAVWRDCGRSETCEPDGRLVVLVHLLSVSKMTDGEACGEFVHDQRSNAPTVLVYLPRVAELHRTIRAGVGARSNPALATLEIGHLVGLTIAHEVGHALGSPHGNAGVMKARPSLQDVIALRTSGLTFRHEDGAVMRLALVARLGDVVASAR